MVRILYWICEMTKPSSIYCICRTKQIISNFHTNKITVRKIWCRPLWMLHGQILFILNCTWIFIKEWSMKYYPMQSMSFVLYLLLTVFSQVSSEIYVDVSILVCNVASKSKYNFVTYVCLSYGNRNLALLEFLDCCLTFHIPVNCRQKSKQNQASVFIDLHFTRMCWKNRTSW